MRKAFVTGLLLTLAGTGVLIVGARQTSSQPSEPGGSTPADPQVTYTTLPSRGGVLVRELPMAAPAQQPAAIPLRTPPAQGPLLPPSPAGQEDGGAAVGLQPLAPTIERSFDGLDSVSNPVGLAPPDPQVAAGPNHVFEMVNITGRIFNKTGGVVQTFTLASFFLVPSGWFDTDPKIIYDSTSGRWFASYLAFQDNTSGTDYAQFDLAVSQSSDPTGLWCVWQFGYTNVLPDQPAVGLTNDKVTISSNIFDIDGSTFYGSHTMVFEKADVVAAGCGSATYVSFPYDTTRPTVRPAHSLSSVSNQYVAQFDSPSTTNITIGRITGTPDAGNVLLNYWDRALAFNQTTPPDAAQLGSSSLIATNDNRALEAVWRDNTLWVSTHTGCLVAGDPTTRSCLHLLQLNTSATPPTISMELTYGASGAYYYFPAIRTDSSGNLHVVFTRSSSSQYAQARVTGRLVADPAGLQASALLRSGEINFEDYRWGDYLGAGVDPATPSWVWVVGEYAKNDGFIKWGTYIGAVSFGGTPTPTPTPTPAPGGCTLSGPLTVVARDLPEAAPTPEGPPRLIPRLAPEKPADGAAPAPETNVVDGATTRPLQALAPPEITHGFDGVDFNDNAATLTPPDPQLAVGSSHVFEMVNITGRIFNKGGGVVDTFPLATFFDVPVGWFDFDPKIIYDDISDRWFASYASILDNLTGTDYGRLHLAVSQTSDPTGAWNVFSCQYSDGNFPDYPAIGVTDDKFTVSANMFDIDAPTGGFAGVQTIVLQKSDVMAGDPSPGVYQFPYNVGRFTVRPAHSLSSTSDQYLAWFDAFSFTLLDYSRITGTPNAGNVTEQPAITKTILSQDSPPSSLTAGSGQIDSGDWRLLEAIWRDGRLWVSGSAKCRPSGDSLDRSCAHLVEINTAGAGTVVNDIMFGASGEYFSWPAIRTDSQGNLHVSLTHTTPSIWAEARVAGRLATDPANTMSGSTVLRAGEVLHDSGRWGDYMGAAVDPADPNYVWVVGQYAKDTGSSGPTGNWDWGTYIGAVSFSGTNCQAGVDTDGDAYNNDDECYVDTDPLDACPDWQGGPGLCPGGTCNGDDAWPLDVDVSQQVNIADVFKYKGKIGKSVGDPDYMQRLDLDASGQVNIADVFLYKGNIGHSCTNP